MLEGRAAISGRNFMKFDLDKCKVLLLRRSEPVPWHRLGTDCLGQPTLQKRPGGQ